jgi:hypothetical protein
MRFLGFLGLMAIITLGCGMDAKRSANAGKRADSGAAAESASDAPASSAQPRESAKPPNIDTLQRKIIFTGTVELVVEQFDPVPTKIAALAKQFNAYVSKSNIAGSQGTPRHGQWTIRVPVDRYEDLLDAARQLGEIRSIGSNSQDVSEEYYDIDAHSRNLKQEEDRLKKLMADNTGKLEDILALEKELTRVRGEIEQLEGKLEKLNKLSAMSTVNLNVQEIKGYVPEDAATYATRIRRTWQVSTTALVDAGQSLSIAAVAVAPWLGVFLVPGVLLIVFVRRCRPRKTVAPTEVSEKP